MGPPKAGPVTQTNKIELAPEQKAIADLALPYAQSFASSTPQLFAGNTIAGFNPNEIAGQNAALVAAGSPLVAAGATAQQALLDPAKMLDVANNPYVKGSADAITQQVTQNLNENILPGVRSGATSAGGMYTGGATKEGIATGKAITGTNQGLSNALADLYLKSYAGGLSTMTQAVANNPQALQTQLFPSQVQGAVGAQQRSMEQALLNKQVADFYGNQNLDYDRAAQLYSLIGAMPGASGVSTVNPSMPQSNPFAQAAGIGISLLGNAMLPGLGSAAGAGMGMGMGK